MLKYLGPRMGMKIGYQFQGFECETWIAISEKQLFLEYVINISDRK